MKILNKNFVLVFLFIFSIPFISCEDSTDPKESNGLWVPMRIGSCSQNSFPVIMGKDFDHYAQVGCEGIQMNYSGEKECRDGVPWVKCID